MITINQFFNPADEEEVAFLNEEFLPYFTKLGSKVNVSSEGILDFFSLLSFKFEDKFHEDVKNKLDYWSYKANFFKGYRIVNP